MALCLTFEPAMVVSAATVGGAYGIIYNQSLRLFVQGVSAESDDKVNVEESKYVDKSFKL